MGLCFCHYHPTSFCRLFLYQLVFLKHQGIEGQIILGLNYWTVLKEPESPNKCNIQFHIWAKNAPIGLRHSSCNDANYMFNELYVLDLSFRVYFIWNTLLIHSMCIARLSIVALCQILPLHINQSLSLNQNETPLVSIYICIYNSRRLSSHIPVQVDLSLIQLNTCLYSYFVMAGSLSLILTFSNHSYGVHHPSAMLSHF